MVVAAGSLDKFILSEFTHAEECRRVAADVLPIRKSLIESAT